MANTSAGKPSFTTSPSAAKEEPAAETNEQKLKRLNEENEVLRAELVNIDLRRKVADARKS